MGNSHRFAVARGVYCGRRVVCRWFKSSLVILSALGVGRAALAASGTWIDTTSGGLWSTTTNWFGGVVANGTDGIADFSTLNITADDTVHLDTARTIGQLKFGDTTSSNNWILDNNGLATNILTLAVSSGSPTITVNNDTATMNLVLAGTQGFSKSGAGELLLDDGNTFTGSVAINAGTLALGNSGALGGTANNVSVSNGATLEPRRSNDRGERFDHLRKRSGRQRRLDQQQLEPREFRRDNYRQRTVHRRRHGRHHTQRERQWR